MKSVEYEVTAKEEVLNLRRISLEDLILRMEFLGEVLQKRFLEIVPTKITGTSQLDQILELHDLFTKLKNISGFNRHAKLYNQKQHAATLFVSRMAAELIDDVDEMELEPRPSSKAGNPDIRITLGGIPAFIECKNVETENFRYEKEHRKILSIFAKHINSPHQISFNYKKNQTREDLVKIAERVSFLLPSVKSDGNIISHKQFEVGVILREGYSDPTVVMHLVGMLGDITSKEKMPLNVFGVGGRTIAIAGPEVDFGKIIIDKIRRARKQAVENEIYLVAVNSAMFLGKERANQMSVEELFDPKKNTRYSAVVFANFVVGDEDKFKLVPNAFASSPLPKEFQLLFR